MHPPTAGSLRPFVRLACLSIATLGLCHTPALAESRQDLSTLSQSLTFHASFDHGVDADRSQGDKHFLHAPSYEKRFEARPGLPPGGEVVIAKGAGRFGDALRFTKTSTLACFPALKNVAYRTNGWNGTVSFWLSVDPKADLAMGFCDPLQITTRAWNDAAFFVEFEKRTNDIPFRIGVYPDPKVWNPKNRKWEEMSQAEKPHQAASEPTPFGRGRWTHVAFTFENFNTGRPDGVVKLYLDGKPSVTLPAREQTFTWDLDRTFIMMGVGYLGLWDELAVFDRALSAGEIQHLFSLPGGVADLRRGK